MDYQNTDEAIRREACEKVKQIVKAIKAIKIKYYANFSKISEKDQETYQSLERKLEEISDTHDLNSLKVALMQEISEKYDMKDDNNFSSGRQVDPNEILKACYGVIDAEKDALARGKITQAARCQEIFKKYKEQIEKRGLANLITMITDYKREKFAELVQSRENLENSNQKWMDIMSGCNKATSAKLRNEADNVINIKREDREGALLEIG